MKSIDQELYDGLFLVLEGITDCYHEIPPAEAEMPYIHFGQFQVLPNPTKDRLKGLVSGTLHVWSGERIEVSSLCETIMKYSDDFKKTERFYWSLNAHASNYRIMEDNSTNKTLFHGIVDLEFKFY